VDSVLTSILHVEIKARNSTDDIGATRSDLASRSPKRQMSRQMIQTRQCIIDTRADAKTCLLPKTTCRESVPTDLSMEIALRDTSEGFE
jgi:hypothetical protein